MFTIILINIFFLEFAISNCDFLARRCLTFDYRDVVTQYRWFCWATLDTFQPTRHVPRTCDLRTERGFFACIWETYALRPAGVRQSLCCEWNAIYALLYFYEIWCDMANGEKIMKAFENLWFKGNRKFGFNYMHCGAFCAPVVRFHM